MKNFITFIKFISKVFELTLFVGGMIDLAMQSNTLAIAGLIFAPLATFVGFIDLTTGQNITHRLVLFLFQ